MDYANTKIQNTNLLSQVQARFRKDNRKGQISIYLLSWLSQSVQLNSEGQIER